MGAKEFVSQLFKQWEEGDSAPFFNALASDVIWTAKGKTPISGTYHGKDVYFEKCYKPLQGVFAGPTACHVRQIIGEGNVVAVEWHGETPTVHGVPYSQDYCWIVRVREDGTAIQEVTGYYDTAVVNELFVNLPSASN